MVGWIFVQRATIPVFLKPLTLKLKPFILTIEYHGGTHGVTQRH